MVFEFSAYLPGLLSVSVIAIFMAISPGSDFVMVTKNSMFYGRTAGLYSSLGIALAIWVHVAYSIAGLAVIIANSVLLFSIIKYLGAAYLIYVGWQTFKTKPETQIDGEQEQKSLSKLAAFKNGFMSNVLNPKTTIFFLSLFTQVVNPETPVLLQLVYGAIICVAHFTWFSLISIFLSQPALLKKFNAMKSKIEKVVGTILVGFGLKVAMTASN